MTPAKLTGVGTLVLSAFLALFPASAAADDRVIGEIASKNRQAMEAYDLLEYEEARRILNEAVALANRHDIDDSIAATTHLNLAIVYHSGFRDEERARVALIDAVRIDDSVTLSPAYRTRELAELLAAAKREYGGGPAEDSCDDVRGIAHVRAETARQGSAHEVTAMVGNDVRARRLFLYYRPADAGEFDRVRMRRSSGCEFIGEIPANALNGDAVHYYFRAVDGGGRTLANRGTADAPTVLDVVSGGIDSDAELPGVSTDGKREDLRDKFAFVMFPIGSGGGFVTGETEQQGNDVGCCFAPAAFHIAPEAGYILRPDVSIGAVFRIGFPFGANIPNHATFAASGLVRLRYGVQGSLDGFQLVGSLGGGLLRHTVKLESAQPGMNVDTSVSGPLIAGPGIAYWHPLGKGMLKLVAELHTLAGIPVVNQIGTCPGSGCVRPNFAVQLDFNFGISLAF